MIEQTPARRGVELVEVDSDLRDCWNNTRSLRRPLRNRRQRGRDTLLYFAAAWATAYARGARAVFLASEAEVQEIESARRDDRPAQALHVLGA